MRVTPRLGGVGICLCLVTMTPALAFGQSKVEGGPLTGPAVRNAPFSAEATTTIRQTLGDGTQIERRGTARYFRDRAGRIRVEQRISGLEALNLKAEPYDRITIDPASGSAMVYTLDPVARTAVSGPRFAAGLAVGGGDTFAVPLGGPRFLLFDVGRRVRRALAFDDGAHEELLGTQLIEGVEATGRRTTVTVPAGQIGNDRPMQMVYERWESPELKIVVYARSSDPRTGVIEYQLTNLHRAEPRADLFSVPPDYAIRHTIQGVLSRTWISLEFADSPNQANGAGQVARR